MSSYKEQGVPCDNKGRPLCWKDNVDCDVDRCRYWVDCFPLGNCVLRNPKGCFLTLEEAGCIMGITRERVRQIQDRALKKLRMRGKILEEFRRGD